MAFLPVRRDPTLEAADRELEHRQERHLRVYLGVSEIGEPCARLLYIKFRWGVVGGQHSAKTLKRFADGHASEALMAERLRAVPGINLFGTQDECRAVSGHVKGHCDGRIVGLIGAPITEHLWEHKCVGEKGFAELKRHIETLGEKNALKAWNPTYYGQSIVYMHLFRLIRHYMTVATPGTRSELAIRTEASPKDAKALLERAERIVFGTMAPERIGGPDFYRCKWCDAFQICHGTEKPQRTCRTCLYSTPIDEGQWRCERHDKVLTVDEQRSGCADQRTMPSLVNDTQIDVEGETIVYERWRDAGPQS
jgi:hypothetical protein